MECPEHTGVYGVSGRPPLYTSPEEVEMLIQDYLGSTEVPTMSGMAYALGMDRRSLLNYSKKEEFFPTIKRARDFIEAFNEEQLISGKGNVAGLIFNLKNNFNWKDKTEVEQEVKITERTVEFVEPE